MDDQAPVEHGEVPVEEVTIYRLSAGSMYSVPVGLMDVSVRAIIDTAAEVTIISDKIYEALDPTPPKIRDVSLNTAGRGMKVQGMRVGPVSMTLGHTKFEEVLYVAPIEDEMLLGIDFLRRYAESIQIKGAKLVVGGEDIPIHTGGGIEPARILRVHLQQRTVLPPNKVKRATGVIDQKMAACVFEPAANLPVHLPRTLSDGGEMIPVFMINSTEQEIHLDADTYLGQAQEAESVGEPWRHTPDTQMDVDLELGGSVQATGDVQSHERGEVNDVDPPGHAMSVGIEPDLPTGLDTTERQHPPASFSNTGEDRRNPSLDTPYIPFTLKTEVWPIHEEPDPQGRTSLSTQKARVLLLANEARRVHGLIDQKVTRTPDTRDLTKITRKLGRKRPFHAMSCTKRVLGTVGQQPWRYARRMSASKTRRVTGTIDQRKNGLTPNQSEHLLNALPIVESLKDPTRDLRGGPDITGNPDLDSAVPPRPPDKLTVLGNGIVSLPPQPTSPNGPEQYGEVSKAGPRRGDRKTISPGHSFTPDLEAEQAELRRRFLERGRLKKQVAARSKTRCDPWRPFGGNG